MKTKELFCPEVKKVILRDAELDDRLQPTEMIVKSRYSDVNIGTESASVQGYGGPNPPTKLGSAVVGDVVKMGSEVKGYEVGDLIFAWCNHDSHVKCDIRPKEFGWAGFMAGPKIPKDLSPSWAVTVYHYGIGMSAIRQSDVAVGDDVLVVGGGMIGNTAAQLFKAAGASVSLVDLSEKRLEIARQCGIRNAVNPKGTSLLDIAMKATNGRKLNCCVLAIEGSKIINEVIDCMRPYGVILLLGGYRKEAVIDVAPLFGKVQGMCLRIQGAPAWTYGIQEKPYVRYTTLGNYRQILELMRSGNISPEPIISLIDPADCQAAYDAMASNPDRHLGVVFDWTRFE